MDSKSRTWSKHALLFLVAVASIGFSLAAAADDGKIEILWLGQAAVRIKTVRGKVIVIDPWLINNPRTPQPYKDLDALGKVDLILVTHGHGDHFDDAPALAIKNKAPAYMPAGLQASVITLGILPAELAPRMGKGGTVTPLGPGIKITMVRAEHSSELAWKNPVTGKEEQHVGGEPSGYIIELENGFKIDHMCDTGLFGDMKLIAEYYKPDLIMIPVGGNFVLNPKDAAFATREWLKPKFAIPIHYGTNPLMKGTTEEYVQAMEGSPIKIFAMKPGDKIEF